MSNVKIVVDKDFIRRWVSGMSAKEIAEIYGVKYPDVNSAAKRHGLPSRKAALGMTIEECLSQKRQPKRQPPDEAISPREARKSPDFNPERDCRLAATRGQYAALRDLADEWGLPVAKVQARWHIVKP